MKRLVLFVEGAGDVDAAPILVKRIITELNAWSSINLDPHPFMVGEAPGLVKNGYENWKRKLKACLKRRSVGGVLLLLDGDCKKVSGCDFCAATVARSLADTARDVNAGRGFSVAVVFACQEYESWLLAGMESLIGKQLPDGRKVLNVTSPDGDLEVGPRDAKGWMNNAIEVGYNAPRDQEALTQMVDLNTIRKRGMRSFTRLESAVRELIVAIENDQHVATPDGKVT